MRTYYSLSEQYSCRRFGVNKHADFSSDGRTSEPVGNADYWIQGRIGVCVSPRTSKKNLLYRSLVLFAHYLPFKTLETIAARIRLVEMHCVRQLAKLTPRLVDIFSKTHSATWWSSAAQCQIEAGREF
jgi:hypothetical protein